MSRMPWGRIAVVLIVLGASAIILLLNPIRFGLDLQGGSHLLIRVHADESIENDVDDAYAAVRNLLQENQIAVAEDDVSVVLDENATFTKLLDSRNQPPVITFTLANASDIGKAQELIRGRINVSGGDWGMDVVNGNTIKLTMSSLAIDVIRDATVNNVRRSIEQRINTLGVSEPNIALQGNAATSQRIVLQLPGVEDPEEAKRRIQTPGRLEMRMVVYDDAGRPLSGGTREEILARTGNIVPTGTELVPEYEMTKAEAKGATRTPISWHLLYKEAPVDSSYLVDARVTRDQRSSRPAISFTLNAEGGDRFRRMTRANVNKLLATVLDNEAIVVANIESEIGTEGQISGRYTQQDAERVALLLRTGAIPTSMHVEEERSVSPSLGQDSIDMGFNASMWGMIAVAVFMIIYYRMSGIFSVIALLLNIVLIMAFLASFGAVLTVPGIAGIVLTIGMAVDANVLIFERVREELRIGRSVVGAIESGYGKAFGTIFDSNLTTLIAAIFLFQFGTGPIRGFATTITIGILASMFTAVFVTRVIFDTIFALRGNKVAKLSI